MISGNTFDGIEFSPNALATATGNIVEGNYLGANAAGTAATANGANGVSDNGFGPQTIRGNVASGNANAGINVYGSSTVTGNRVGTNAAGTAAVANLRGIFADGPSNTIGGVTAPDRNVVSGNTQAGILITGAGATGNAVRGNYIGPNLAGTASLANGTGIRINADSNTVGGLAAGAGNVISGNGTGVSLDAAGGSATANEVTGNLIGVAPNGVSGMGNTGPAGVLIAGNGNMIGGTDPAAPNEIAYNTGDGVAVSSGTANAINRNKIHTNGGLGIDLDPNGVTANDAGDGDAGANSLLNFPVISTVQNGQINGTLNSAPSTNFDLDFFQSAACDPSGNGEGAAYLGSLSVSTGSDGNVSFAAAPPLIGVGQWVTATATDPAGNTSEFSACVQATANGSQTFVVNATVDQDDGDCSELGDDGQECTLREAIHAANADGTTADTIAFSIPAPGVQTINVTEVALPDITGPVTIDGTTQGIGHLVEVSTSFAITNGFDVEATGVTIRGLIVNSFTEAAIVLRTGGNIVEQSWIGLNELGVPAGATQPYGIVLAVGSDLNTIRGNAIGGNWSAGIHLNHNGLEGSDRNTIVANLIGTDAAGTSAAPNGVGVILAGDLNVLGGDAVAGDHNVISGNAEGGVLITAGTENTVAGNNIGLNRLGSRTIPNVGDGIEVASGGEAEVGTNSVEGRNLIAANAGYGISVTGDSTETRIQGNHVGRAAENPNCVITQPASLASVTASNITFVNNSGAAASIYWLDFSGNRVGYRPGVSGPTPLAAGDSYTQPTWLTHPWVAVDPEGNCIGYTISDVLAKTYVIEPRPELANGAGGIRVSGGSETEIGGNSASERNVVSGNANTGSTSSGRRPTRSCSGNYVGTDATGAVDVPNAREGVRVESGPTTIGGAGETTSSRNVISGNNGFGVLIYDTSDVVVQNNYVGVDASGQNGLGNEWDGIGIDGGSGNTIGGTDEHAGNVVSDNAGQGIAVFGVDFPTTTGNVVQGNVVGFSADGETDLGNDGDGIRLLNATNTTVGGPAFEAGNVVGNNDHGIALYNASTTNNVVARNDVSESISSGILVSGASDNTIGPGNIVFDNGVCVHRRPHHER